MSGERRCCPYCGQPMERGAMDGHGRLCWRPTESRETFFIFTKPRGGVDVLYDDTDGTALAFYCRACKKILLDAR